MGTYHKTLLVEKTTREDFMDKIKELIKGDVPNVEQKIASVASELGFHNLDSISIEEAELIAEEVSKNGSTLAVSTPPATITVPSKTTNGNGNGKKSKTIQTQGNVDMKKVISDLGQTASSLQKRTDDLCSELTEKTVDSISDRLLKVKPDILKNVAARVSDELGDIDTFCDEFERMFRESIPSI
jgi:predicted transcriptional regulator